MANWLIVLLFSIAAVALFGLGMSITLMIKGHFIDSEIATNKNMQNLGITCAVHDAQSEAMEGECQESDSVSHNCATCSVTTK